jgi:rRNA maturation protein Rpf1
MRILFTADRRPTPKLRNFIDAVIMEFGGEEGVERVPGA